MVAAVNSSSQKTLAVASIESNGRVGSPLAFLPERFITRAFLLVSRRYLFAFQFFNRAFLLFSESVRIRSCGSLNLHARRGRSFRSHSLANERHINNIACVAGRSQPGRRCSKTQYLYRVFLASQGFVGDCLREIAGRANGDHRRRHAADLNFERSDTATEQRSRSVFYIHARAGWRRLNQDFFLHRSRLVIQHWERHAKTTGKRQYERQHDWKNHARRRGVFAPHG